ncbi:hypothetical protein ACQPZQ_13215 [Pseudonocardia sp. CA-142604]|uniref:hypothetical protein n=1 Tax=Pseudonocardia sp. CA-142604 TaxID=3240024 RepID=UPI003D8CD8B2
MDTEQDSYHGEVAARERGRHLLDLPTRHGRGPDAAGLPALLGDLACRYRFRPDAWVRVR